MARKELYPAIEKAVIEKVKGMSLNDLRNHLITETINYYMYHADKDEIESFVDYHSSAMSNPLTRILKTDLKGGKDNG